MFYEELSEYVYYPNLPTPNVRMVGWLNRAHPYQVGDVSKKLMTKLKELMRGSENVDVHVSIIRGIHPCEICDENELLDARLLVGSSEIWLPVALGGFVAAPSMILHYIEVHSYLPPNEFLEAVGNFDLEVPYNAQSEYLRIYAEMTKG